MANLTTVIHRLQQQRNQAARTLAQIDAAISALDGAGRRTARQGGGRRKLSAAARRKIAVAQKARWAKWRKAKKSD